VRQHSLTSATLALLMMLGTATIAEADRPLDTRLIYVVPSIAQGCPREGALIDAVAARLGRDPFKAYAQRTLRVVIVPGDLYGARIELSDANGAALGEKEIPSAPSCEALKEPLALAIALALDPLQLVPPPEPEPPPSPLAPPPEPTAGLFPYFSGGALVAIGTLPAATPGGRLEGGIAGDRWSAGLEGRFEAPASKAVEGGEVSAYLLAAGLSGCFRYEQLEGCLVGVAGSLRAQSEGLVSDQSASAAYATVGARARYVVVISPLVSIALAADLAAVTTRIEVVDSRTGAEYWATPIVHGILALEGRFTPTRSKAVIE
jgi:hypothetical protein